MSHYRQKDLLCLICSFFIFILFSLLCPAKGEALTLTGRVATLSGTALNGVQNIYIYLYKKQDALDKGLIYAQPVGVSDSNGNFSITNVALSTEYLLLFSTRALAGSKEYLDFFYGRLTTGGSYVIDTRVDPSIAPTLRYDSPAYTSGSTVNISPLIYPYQYIEVPKGFYLKGLIKNESGNPLEHVAIEIYQDQNGVPASMPYPLYRVVETSSTAQYNFKIGGLRIGGKYYVRAVPDNLKITDTRGYIGSFYTIPATGAPKPFQMPSSYSATEQNAGELVLKRGGRLWGYLKNQAGQPVSDASISMQAMGYKGQQFVYSATYLHDPNASLYAQAPLWDKYYFGFNLTYYNSNGMYEMKGLSYEGNDFYLFATEVPPPDTDKKYATPLFYDGNTCTYNSNDAKAISLGDAGGEFRADFLFKPGGSIKGSITLETSMNTQTQAALNITADDLDVLPMIVDAYYVESDGSVFWAGHGVSEGAGAYSVSGLPAGTYLIKAYDQVLFYPEKYFNNKSSFTSADEITLPSGGSVTGKNFSLALGGLLSGRVLNGQGGPLEGAVAIAYRINPSNPLVGYYFASSEGVVTAQYPTQTDPNGRFFIWGLPTGSYSLLVNGVIVNTTTAYNAQYYAPLSGGAVILNQAEPVDVAVNNPALVSLSSIALDSAGSESGGIISGAISSQVDANVVDLSSPALFLTLIDAATGITVPNAAYRFDTDSMGTNSLPYSVIVPEDGEYILTIRDQAGLLLPHYYNSTQTKVEKGLATHITVDHTVSGKKFISGINLNLSRLGAVISGKALGDGGVGVAGLDISASQQILDGPDKGAWKIVTKTATAQDGSFSLRGLTQGTYIFSVYDTAFNYVGQYYHPSQDVYKPDGAFKWTYSLSDTSPPPVLTFNLKRGGKVTGFVSPNGTLAQVFVNLNGDEKIGYSVAADPNFTLKGLIPGEYTLACKDLESKYLPVYYVNTTDPNSAQTITVVSGQTFSAGTITFSQQGAKVEGHIYKKTGTGSQEPMSNMYVFLYHAFPQERPWVTEPLVYDLSDTDGSYSLTGLDKGEYRVMAFGTQFRPIIKGLSISSSDLGNTKGGQDFVFPSDWLNLKQDKSLSLEKGLNLVAYPTLISPVINGYTSSSFVQDVAMATERTSLNLKSYFPQEKVWKGTSFSSIGIEGVYLAGLLGEPFTLRNGQGFLCYSGEQKDIAYRFYPGQTPLWLHQGENLIGNIPVDPNMVSLHDPNFMQDQNFTTRKLLLLLGEGSSFSVQIFDAKAGKWQSNYWMWGRTSGIPAPTDDPRGYLLYMKKTLLDWYPKR